MVLGFGFWVLGFGFGSVFLIIFFPIFFQIIIHLFVCCVDLIEPADAPDWLKVD